MYTCKVLSDKTPIATQHFDPSLTLIDQDYSDGYHCMYVDLPATQCGTLLSEVSRVLGSCMISALHCSARNARDVLNTPESRLLEGFRLAEVVVNARAFGAAVNRSYTITFVYDSRRNFNITPPMLGTERINVGYCLDLTSGFTPQHASSTLQSSRIDSYRYGVETVEGMASVPIGFSPDDLARYNIVTPYGLPDTAYRVSRFGLLRKSGSIECVIHPEGHRNLTLRELAMCYGWSESDIHRYTVNEASLVASRPALLGKWVSLQILQYLQDTWGQDDWWSSYSYIKQRFAGGDAADMPVKRYNLVEWYRH